MSRSLAAAERLASDVVALTALPARWIGAPPDRIADDVAATLYHLCDVALVQVRLDLPPARRADAVRPAAEASLLGRQEEPALVHRTDQVILPIGQFGRHGSIALLARSEASASYARLLGTIAANAVESACRALDLERDVAQAHAKVAALSKLGALGQLVGGVAHELRTPLTYATTNLYLVERDILKRYPDAAEDVRPKLAEVASSFDRITGIVNQLRRLSRQQSNMAVEEDLRDAIRDGLRLWRATHVDGPTIEEDLLPTPPVLVDRGQIQQVLINLLQNAAEALNGAPGPIRVRTKDGGSHALLVVEDEGPGITPEVQATLFQAFRTTKATGLGLGLSIVRGIIESHRGTIHVASGVGHGTRVEVRIPRAGALTRRGAPADRRATASTLGAASASEEERGGSSGG